MFHSIEPQDGPNALAPHPHRLTLRGEPRSVAFPPLCPHCGGAANHSLAYSKVFRQVDVESRQYFIETVRVPFCDPCIERHRAQDVQPSLFELMRCSLGSVHMVGALFPAMGALFVLHLALGDMVHRQATRGLVECGIAAVFALIAWLQTQAVLAQTAPLRVHPQTDVTRAFDFSYDVSDLFEGRRFVCTMRNGQFANAFRILNIQREWQPQSAAAIAEHKRSNLLTWIVCIAVGIFMLWDFVRGWSS